MLAINWGHFIVTPIKFFILFTCSAQLVSTCCAALSKLAALLAHRRVLEHQTPQGRRCVLAHGWAGHGV